MRFRKNVPVYGGTGRFTNGRARSPAAGFPPSHVSRCRTAAGRAPGHAFDASLLAPPHAPAQATTLPDAPALVLILQPMP